jgi:hypothetical protein
MGAGRTAGGRRHRTGCGRTDGGIDPVAARGSRRWCRPVPACDDLGVTAADHQTVRVLDGLFVLERPGDVAEVSSGAGILAAVFGPDGTTVIRRDDGGRGEDAWSALWNGDAAHDVQATGMLSAIVAPLAAGGVPVWAVSSYDGDVVLVPAGRLAEASGLLEAAGHQVRRS